MYLYYLIALVPAIAGLVWSFYNPKVNMVEWAIGSAIAFGVAGIFHIATLNGMQEDVEYWSGKVVDAQYSPEWVEYLEEAIYRTEHHTRTRMNSEGHLRTEHYTDRHFDHYEPRNTTHFPSYEANISYGGEFERIGISRSTFFDYANTFGSTKTNYVEKSTSSHASRFQSGDHNIYNTYVGDSGAIIPYITKKDWKNKAKASPSTFSYNKVPEGIPVFSYPDKVGFQSGRLLGDAVNKISITEFDKMNSRLNPLKKVNVIVVGFLDSPDAKLGRYQEEKWLGGKKNDLVICYGIGALEEKQQGIVWVRCFSWCENKQLKQDIEKLFLNNPIDTSILVSLEKIIKEGYTLYDWSKLDYIKVKPTTKILIFYIVFVILLQSLMYWFFSKNDFDDDDSNSNSSYNNSQYR